MDRFSASSKDYFSSHSSLYATFRPDYPEQLYQFIFQYLNQKNSAWDCATGNGQVARYLSKHFDHVYATDISQQQLSNAYHTDNIQYASEPAEKTSFNENQFDLISVAQALHWFDLPAFYKEVKRAGKPGSLLAVWGYNIPLVSPEIDRVILDFYTNIVGPYWDNARKLVEDSYRSIPFPFEEINAPVFKNEFAWTIEQLAGYITTWSATQKYIKENNADPVQDLLERIKFHWRNDELKTIQFSTFLRAGRINK